MTQILNKNVNGKWIRIPATDKQINQAKENTVKVFDQAIDILDTYKVTRKSQNKRELTVNEELILINLLSQHYAFGLESIIDESILNNSNKEAKEDEKIKRYEDIDF